MVKKILVILETVGVFLVGSLAAIASIVLFELAPWLDQAGSILLESPIDFNALSERTLVSTALKYSWIFLLMFGLALLIKKPLSLKSLGITRNGMSVSKILKYALLVLCLGGILPKAVFALWPTGLLGDGLTHWHLLKEPWDGSFWTFMLISSIIMPPVVEELFFRGYMQARFHTVFKPQQTILLTAIIFTLFHTQYFVLSTIHLLMLLSLFIGAWLLSYVRYVTGSLLPCLIAHALVNIPVIGDVAWILVAVMVVILFYFWIRKDPILNFKLSET